MRWLALLVVTLTLAASPRAHAVQPDEILPDATLETRARVLSKELRCMVCQNQSIDNSDAPLARDLRVLVRERLQAGDSDQQVIDFLVVALRRVRAAQAAVFMAHRVVVACSDGDAAHRSVRPPGVRTPPPSQFGPRNRGAGKTHPRRGGAAVGDFTPRRAMRRRRHRTSNWEPRTISAFGDFWLS